MVSQIPTFLVVEDHPEVAQNNCLFLQKLDPTALCVIAQTPEEALKRLKLETPSLVVLDLQFGTIRGEQSAQPGLDLLQQIFTHYPTLNILIYTSEYSYLRGLSKSLSQHVGGFVVVSKLERRKAFLEGAHYALNGELHIPRDLHQELVLNEKDLKVLELLCKESLTDKAIAHQMNISLKTAQNYVQRLKVKLNLENSDSEQVSPRVSLCMEAVRRKVIIL